MERYLIQCPFLGGSPLRGSTVLLDNNLVQYNKQYFEILVYHENLVLLFLSFCLLSLAEKLNEILPKTLKVCLTAIVRGGW